MKQDSSSEWIPGIESETNGKTKNTSFWISAIVSGSLFLLLPLSEFIKEEQWIVREVEPAIIETPPPPKTKLEQKLENNLKNLPSPKPIEAPNTPLKVEALSANLDVSPGDFKAQFSLNQFNPVTNNFEGELVFSLHELDRNPSVLKRGILRYPTHLKKRGVEGEVKLLVQINEKGSVEVLEIVSYTHPDFIEPSKKAAESSTYEAPKRNGEPVKVQFYLPVRYSLLN